jgi:hypothetical protein
VLAVAKQAVVCACQPEVALQLQEICTCQQEQTAEETVEPFVFVQETVASIL